MTDDHQRRVWHCSQCHAEVRVADRPRCSCGLRMTVVSEDWSEEYKREEQNRTPDRVGKGTAITPVSVAENVDVEVYVGTKEQIKEAAEDRKTGE